MDFVLLDKTAQPSVELLKKTLGESFPHYQSILERTADLKHEWKFYGKSGWQLKISNKKRAVLYVVPQADCFMTGMAVSDDEKETLLAADISPHIQNELTTSKRYQEGWPVRMIIREKDDFTALAHAMTLVGRMS